MNLAQVTATAATLVTVAVIVGIGALKTAGIIDADTVSTALVFLGGGGAGVAIGGALSKGSA